MPKIFFREQDNPIIKFIEYIGAAIYVLKVLFEITYYVARIVFAFYGTIMGGHMINNAKENQLNNTNNICEYDVGNWLKNYGIMTLLIISLYIIGLFCPYEDSSGQQEYYPYETKNYFTCTTLPNFILKDVNNEKQRLCADFTGPIIWIMELATQGYTIYGLNIYYNEDKYRDISCTKENWNIFMIITNFTLFGRLCIVLLNIPMICCYNIDSIFTKYYIKKKDDFNEYYYKSNKDCCNYIKDKIKNCCITNENFENKNIPEAVIVNDVDDVVDAIVIV